MAKSNTAVDSRDLDNLIEQLTCDEVIKCQKARRSLVEIGKPAVPSLIKALSSPKLWVRWEAAKALSQIADPAATDSLIKLLEDKQFDMRWMAAEGLINIGYKALIPVLEALLDHPDSTWLQEGTHHILGDLARGKYKPVLKPIITALESFQPSIDAPIAIRQALSVIRSSDF